MDLAGRNAADHLGREQARWLADDGKTLVALEELAAALGLAGPPLRIECYDISTIQGRETVGSMVVFEDGRPRTGAYRRFRIKDVAGQDDFASHAEMLRRRLYRGKAGEEGSAEEQRWALPDLIVVDGGKGQLAADVAVLRELGLDEIPIAGLAKEREELFLPGRPDPVVLPPTSSALYLVQRIRDEAHRFAITYHRDLRRRAAVKSAFDDLPGAGARPPARAAAHLRLGQARPGGAGRAGGGRAGHRARAGGPDQGAPRGGVTGRARIAARTAPERPARANGGSIPRRCADSPPH